VTGLSLGTVALQAVGVGLSTVTATVTALVGAFVAYQGYRGYRRNDSRPMLYLAVGILLLTTVTFLVQQVVGLATSGAVTAQFAALTVSIAGLLAVLYSFTGA